jgi:hypothetical protein
MLLFFGMCYLEASFVSKVTTVLEAVAFQSAGGVSDDALGQADSRPGLDDGAALSLR